MPSESPQIWYWILTLAVGVLGFFLKRGMDQLDRTSERCDNITTTLSSYATRAELVAAKTEVEQQIRNTRTDFFGAIEGVRNNEIRQLHEMLREDSKSVRAEINEVRREIGADIAELSQAMREEIRSLNSIGKRGHA